MNNQKNSAGRLVARVLILALGAPPIPALAAPPVVLAPGGGGATVTTSANGVAVVNINAANGAGLSHNKFTDYNVPANGLVLNNGDSSQISRLSQLAGQVPFNVNLISAARVILNEVVSTNRSLLNGWTEVLGGRADVVVANPNGITCSGCGFINTDRVSLATGSPNLGADGSLRGFSVNRGDILIDGAGLNASGQQYLDLVSRSVKLDGQINVPVLRITTGNNVWDYASALVTGSTAPGGAVPAYAFDSTLLGAMYAGRIMVVATEAGVGVRMLGQAAASADDFSINAAGRIDVRSKVSAERDLSLTSTASGADAIALSDANLSARNNLNLVATSGGATITGGVLVANNDLSVNLGTLTDIASAALITDNNKRYAGRTMTLATAGAASLNGVNYGAGSALSGNFGSLSIGADSASLSAGTTLGLTATGNLALGRAAIRSAGDLELNSSAGNISTTAGAGQGVQSTAGNLGLTAASGINNAGTISADAGNVTVRANGTISNSGTMHAFAALDMADKAGAATENVSNSGKLLGGTMNMKANALSVVNGGSVETTGSMDLALNSLAVGGAGDSTSRIVAATSGAGTGTISSATGFSNYGVLHSGKNLVINAPAVTNWTSGGISALDTLTVNATSGDLLNQGAMYAGLHLNASASGTFTNDATLAAVMGTLDSGGDMNLTANVFANYSDITAAGNITITAATFKNEIKGGDTRIWSLTHPNEAARHFHDGALDTYVNGSTYNCNFAGVDTCVENNFRRNWFETQSYSAGVPGHKPQIVGAGTIAIQGFNTGSNLGGLISGNVVTFTGNGGGASFTNDALDLLRKDYSFTYTLYYERWWVGDSGIDGRFQWQSGTTTTPSLMRSLGAGIRAGTLNAGGFALTNLGSVYTQSPTVLTADTTPFPGLVLTLPTNPNGFFVASQNPASHYLVESNPLYTSKNAVGSDYLAKLMGFDTDVLAKRLGDAGYENYLIRQQLIAQSGGNLLKGYGNETAQVQRLMEQGASQAKSMGLNFGTGLSASQQAGLKEDMVWLVETTVAGQKVLAPVVYLAAATRALIVPGGAVIAADQANLNLTSLTNTGGTISADSLKVTTQGDITNTSGVIKGGDVSLTSSQGSIINQTLTETTGNDSLQRTTIGRQAGIQSTGTLNLDAAKDITVLGGRVAAGGDATLAAGGNVTLDTIQNKSGSISHDGQSVTTESKVMQIGSELSSGGNLTVKAKGDITLAGSEVNASGNAALDAGGDLNIVARDNISKSVTTSEKEGFGVGGGLYGTEKTTTDDFKSRNFGSTINAGGDLSLSAGKTATIQGSTVNSTGSTSIAAQDVQVLAGKDVDRTTTSKETTSFLSLSAGDDAKTNTTAKAGVKSDGQVKAGVTASATNDAGGLDFKKTTKTSTFDEDSRSVGSSLTTGKNLTITSRKDITLQGARVDVKGDADLTGQNVNILAAQDTHTSTSSTSTTRVGLYASTTNTADATALAGATATAVVGSAAANAGASATANAASSTNIDFMRTKTTDTASLDVVNKGTTLASGGVLRINSAKTLTVQGSDVSGDKGVDVKAKDMAFLAAQDTHSSTTNTTSSSAGLYVDGTANANASANANANAGLGANAGVKAEAGVKAQVSVGIQAKNTTSKDTEGSSTARVSTITSGSGSITRKAENSIADVGTAIDAAGDFSQSAKTITSKAAANTSYSTSDSTTNSAKIGVYAKAEAGVSAEAGASAGLGGAKAGAGTEVKAGVGVGIKASYARDSTASSSDASDAVVSTIKAGGKVSSVSTDKTSFEGTKISGGKGVELEAGSIDFAAAKSTTSSTSSVGNTNASASFGLSRGTGKGVDVDVAAGTSKTDKSASTSTASAGSIESGGNVVIKTRGDTRLEGTNIAATGDTSVAAGGNLIFDAARDTRSSSKTAYDANASLSTTKSTSGGSSSSGVSAGVSGGYSKSTAESSTATAGSVTSGGKLTLSAGKSASFEGTNLAAGGDATISGKDGVTMSAARSTSSSESFGVRAGVEVGKGKETGADGTTNSKSAGGTVEGNYSRAKESNAAAGSVSSGGNLTIISNKDVTLEGTALAADKKASIQAGGNVNFKAAESTSESVGFSASLSAKVDKADKTPTAPAPAKKPVTPVADPAKPTKPGTGGTQGSDGSKQSAADLAKWQDKQGSVVQQLKDKQSGAGATPPAKPPMPATPPPALPGTAASKPAMPTTPPPALPGTTGTKPALPTTPPPALPGTAAGKPAMPTTPPPALPGAAVTKPALPTTPPPALPGTVAGKPAMPKTPPPALPGATVTKPALPKTPPPALPGASTAPETENSGPTTEKTTAVSGGAQLQLKNKTTQNAGSISAGAGGIDIVSAGGDVNLVGTKINTDGDANISAKRDVNISATRNTESGFSASAAASVDKKREGPTPPAKPGAIAPASQPGKPALPKTPPPPLPGTTVTKPALPKTPPPPLPGTTVTKPALPKTPPPPLPGTTVTKPALPKTLPPALPGTTVTKPALPKTSPPPLPGTTVTKPALPKTPPPALVPKLDLKGAANAGAGAGAVKTLIGDKTPNAPAVSTGAAAEEKDPNKFGGDASRSVSTNKDPDNKSDAFIGIGGGGSIKNQGAAINTGGKLNIKSGGKTTLTNTDIKAADGENIDAQGGVERKTEKDVNVLNASTNSGPAATGQGMSKVPTASTSPTTGAPVAPGSTTDTAQGTSGAPQSAIKAAQGAGGSKAGGRNP